MDFKYTPAVEAAKNNDEQAGLDILPASSYDISVNPEASVDANETKRLLIS